MSILKDLLALSKPETIVENEDLEASDALNWSEDLQSIHAEISKLMAEARSIIRKLPRSFRGSAEAYWIPHIMIALGGEHEWMTAGHESTMQKTIDDLKDEASASSDENDDDVGDHEYR